MKAVVYRRYGSPDELALEQVPKPTPGSGEVLIRVHAVSLNRSDWEFLTGTPLYGRIGGLFRPGHRILGSDVAGRIESVGPNVRRLAPGMDVFGDLLRTHGGFAEYVCAREDALAVKPAGLGYEQASAIPQAAVIALQGLRDKGRVEPGQRVLINGAAGGAGMFAVQLAKLYGAEVTGVDHGDKLDFVRSLGADVALDYTREDYTRTGRTWDVILDLAAHRSVSDYARALAPGGRFLVVGGSMATLLQVLLLGWTARRSGKQIGVLVVRPNLADLAHVAELCEAGKLVPVVDQRYPLDRVPDALRVLGDGRARGKLVIVPGDG